MIGLGLLGVSDALPGRSRHGGIEIAKPSAFTSTKNNTAVTIIGIMMTMMLTESESRFRQPQVSVMPYPPRF
jgi:hypothetical protein